MDIELSLCIATFNRAAFLTQAIQSIVPLLTNQCEIVVVDNASDDDTDAVLARHAELCPRLRYFRNASNIGLDRNFDRAIECASGTYCWLLSDDDVLKPGAVERVLKALESKPSLVVANAEFRDFTLSNVVQSRAIDATHDRVYPAGTLDRLFGDLAEDSFVAYIGNIIIRRDVWLARDRASYYDSSYIHVGVIFQRELPENALFISDPLVSIRMGNTNSWTARRGEMAFAKWPNTIASLAISQSARRKLRSGEPWREYLWLLHLRAQGSYFLSDYRLWIRPRLKSLASGIVPAFLSVVPIIFANRILMAWYSVYKRPARKLHVLKSYAARTKTLKGDPAS